MRKDAGLSVEDRIRLGVRATPNVQQVLDAYGPRVRDDVGATDLYAIASANGAPSNGDGFTWAGDLEGEDVELALQRV